MSAGRKDVCWTRLSAVGRADGRSAPLRRAAAACAFLPPYLLVHGGRCRVRGLLRDLWRFDTENGAWEKLDGAKLPMLEGHSVATVENRLYIFGGLYARPGPLAGSALWVLKQSGTASRVTSKSGAASPSSRRGHSFTAVKHSIYLFGGHIDLHGATNTLWRFETETKTWTLLTPLAGVAPSGTFSHSAVAFNGSIWMFGGCTSTQSGTDYFWRYNIEENSWSQPRVSRRPSPRLGHSACLVGAEMFLFGGQTPLGARLDDLWCFNFGSLSWRRLDDDSGPPAMQFARLVSLDDAAVAAAQSRVQLIKNTSENLCYTDLESRAAVAEHRPQRSADSGYVEQFSSQDQLLSRAAVRPNSIDSDMYIVNPAFEREVSLPDVPLPPPPPPSLAEELLPGAVPSESTDLNANQFAKALNPKPRTRSGGAPPPEHLQLSSYMRSPFARRLDGWTAESDEMAAVDAAPRYRLCSHADGRCAQLLLVGGNEATTAVVAFEPLSVWIGCVR